MGTREKQKHIKDAQALLKFNKCTYKFHTKDILCPSFWWVGGRLGGQAAPQNEWLGKH